MSPQAGLKDLYIELRNPISETRVFRGKNTILEFSNIPDEKHTMIHDAKHDVLCYEFP